MEEREEIPVLVDPKGLEVLAAQEDRLEDSLGGREPLGIQAILDNQERLGRKLALRVVLEASFRLNRVGNHRYRHSGFGLGGGRQDVQPLFTS